MKFYSYLFMLVSMGTICTCSIPAQTVNDASSTKKSRPVAERDIIAELRGDLPSKIAVLKDMYRKWTPAYVPQAQRSILYQELCACAGPTAPLELRLLAARGLQRACRVNSSWQEIRKEPADFASVCRAVNQLVAAENPELIKFGQQAMNHMLEHELDGVTWVEPKLYATVSNRLMSEKQIDIESAANLLASFALKVPAFRQSPEGKAFQQWTENQLTNPISDQRVLALSCLDTVHATDSAIKSLRSAAETDPDPNVQVHAYNLLADALVVQKRPDEAKRLLIRLAESTNSESRVGTNQTSAKSNAPKSSARDANRQLRACGYRLLGHHFANDPEVINTFIKVIDQEINANNYLRRNVAARPALATELANSKFAWRWHAASILAYDLHNKESPLPTNLAQRTLDVLLEGLNMSPTDDYAPLNIRGNSAELIHYADQAAMPIKDQLVELLPKLIELESSVTESRPNPPTKRAARPIYFLVKKLQPDIDVGKPSRLAEVRKQLDQMLTLRFYVSGKSGDNVRIHYLPFTWSDNGKSLRSSNKTLLTLPNQTPTLQTLEINIIEKDGQLLWIETDQSATPPVSTTAKASCDSHSLRLTYDTPDAINRISGKLRLRHWSPMKMVGRYSLHDICVDDTKPKRDYHLDSAEGF